MAAIAFPDSEKGETGHSTELENGSQQAMPEKPTEPARTVQAPRFENKVPVLVPC